MSESSGIHRFVSFAYFMVPSGASTRCTRRTRARIAYLNMEELTTTVFVTCLLSMTYDNAPPCAPLVRTTKAVRKCADEWPSPCPLPENEGRFASRMSRSSTENSTTKKSGAEKRRRNRLRRIAGRKNSGENRDKLRQIARFRTVPADTAGVKTQKTVTQ